MNQKIIDLLEKAKQFTGTTGCSRRINQAITLLKQQPTASEFTKENRSYFTLLPEEECDTLIQKAVRHCSLVIQEACDRLDTSEASRKELLEACVKVQDWNEKYPSSTIYGHEAIIRIAAELDEIVEQTKAAIAKAVKEQS